MCLLGYTGFLRFDELVNIRRNDILFEDKQIRLFIQKSKTDQFKNGFWLVIAKTGKGHLSSQVSLFVFIRIKYSAKSLQIYLQEIIIQ